MKSTTNVYPSGAGLSLYISNDIQNQLHWKHHQKVILKANNGKLTVGLSYAGLKTWYETNVFHDRGALRMYICEYLMKELRWKPHQQVVLKANNGKLIVQSSADLEVAA